MRLALHRSLTPTCAFAIALAIGLALHTPSADAVGTLADLSVRDRVTNEVLTVYQYQGHWWIAGMPGHQYAVVVRNGSAARVMTVVSVDGINAVSGQTALADQLAEQSGYVLSPWQRTEITGWRKSQSEVAAFEFTSFADTYAARTGRAAQVGVIGIAVFRERAPVSAASAPARDSKRETNPNDYERADAGANQTRDFAKDAATEPAPSQAPKAAGSLAEADASSARARRTDPLGTGHGARESSWVNYTQFDRAQAQPDEIIAIHYDRRETLIAMGVIPTARALPNPFPPIANGFVPDPPTH